MTMEYCSKEPIAELADFVESFWMLANDTDEEKSVSCWKVGRSEGLACALGSVTFQ